MVNMRAGLPRLGTVCDEYRLGDLALSGQINLAQQLPLRCKRAG